LRRNAAGDVKKLSQKENENWKQLYNYVKKEILLYDDSQKIPSDLVLILKGIASGKAIDNKRYADQAEYSFDVILYTFKACKSKILNSIHGLDFNSERSKMVYISKIIEGNINDIYLRLKQVEESKSKTEQIKTDNLTHEGAEYKLKTQNVKNNKLNDLW